MLEQSRARGGAIVFGVMGGLLAVYLAWLVVRGPQALQLGVTNGWVGTAFRLAAGVVCLFFGLRRRRGSYAPLVFGVALIFTAIGNTILTLDSLRGPPPPPPTPADFFGLGFITLCFAGIGLMAREDRQRLSPSELLDGGIAALGAGAGCAAFVLDASPACREIGLWVQHRSFRLRSALSSLCSSWSVPRPSLPDAPEWRGSTWRWRSCCSLWVPGWELRWA